uniref:Uncharacterized protein n=1 Tax=Panstrongylus lignarius TaxID=156445 RepID=A0A224XUN8_9HEMI
MNFFFINCLSLSAIGSNAFSLILLVSVSSTPRTSTLICFICPSWVVVPRLITPTSIVFLYPPNFPYFS